MGREAWPWVETENIVMRVEKLLKFAPVVRMSGVGLPANRGDVLDDDVSWRGGVKRVKSFSHVITYSHPDLPWA